MGWLIPERVPIRQEVKTTILSGEISPVCCSPEGPRATIANQAGSRGNVGIMRDDTSQSSATGVAQSFPRAAIKRVAWEPWAEVGDGLNQRSR